MMVNFSTLTFISLLEHHFINTIRLCSNLSTSSPNREVSSANSKPGRGRPPHSTPHLFSFNSPIKPLMYSENNRGDSTQPCLRPVLTEKWSLRYHTYSLLIIFLKGSSLLFHWSSSSLTVWAVWWRCFLFNLWYNLRAPCYVFYAGQSDHHSKWVDIIYHVPTKVSWVVFIFSKISWAIHIFSMMWPGCAKWSNSKGHHFSKEWLTNWLNCASSCVTGYHRGGHSYHPRAKHSVLGQLQTSLYVSNDFVITLYIHDVCYPGTCWVQCCTRGLIV